MNEEQIRQKVRSIIDEMLAPSDMETVTDSTRFIDDLGADSLDTVELVMAAEEEFDIEILDEEAEKLLTVGDAIAYIKGKLA